MKIPTPDQPAWAFDFLKQICLYIITKVDILVNLCREHGFRFHVIQKYWHFKITNKNTEQHWSGCGGICVFHASRRCGFSRQHFPVLFAFHFFLLALTRAPIKITLNIMNPKNMDWTFIATNFILNILIRHTDMHIQMLFAKRKSWFNHKKSNNL